MTGTMITVTRLVFALTVVTLQIAGTQFSPRLLRSFLRDRGTQMVLSTFVGTVSYSLAGLHTVGSNIGGVPVPRLGVSGALVLALISVGMLVYYLGHITNAIRIDTIMRSAPATCCAGTTNGWRRQTTIPTPRTAPQEGYLQGVETHLLTSLARREGLTVRLLQLVGHHIVEGQPLVAIWTDDGSAPARPPFAP